MEWGPGLTLSRTQRVSCQIRKLSIFLYSRLLGFRCQTHIPVVCTCILQNILLYTVHILTTLELCKELPVGLQTKTNNKIIIILLYGNDLVHGYRRYDDVLSYYCGSDRPGVLRQLSRCVAISSIVYFSLAHLRMYLYIYMSFVYNKPALLRECRP